MRDAWHHDPAADNGLEDDEIGPVIDEIARFGADLFPRWRLAAPLRRIWTFMASSTKSTSPLATLAPTSVWRLTMRPGMGATRAVATRGFGARRGERIEQLERPGRPFDQYQQRVRRRARSGPASGPRPTSSVAPSRRTTTVWPSTSSPKAPSGRG